MSLILRVLERKGRVSALFSIRHVEDCIGAFRVYLCLDSLRGRQHDQLDLALFRFAFYLFRDRKFPIHTAADDESASFPGDVFCTENGVYPNSSRNFLPDVGGGAVNSRWKQSRSQLQAVS